MNRTEEWKFSTAQSKQAARAKSKRPPQQMISNLPTVQEGDVENGTNGKPSAKQQKQLDRQEVPMPFGYWACVWRPYRAMNPDQFEPFATLEVTVIRAFGLVAADVNNKSDPYCKLLVNGSETGDRTEVVPKNLAPAWKQTFDINIYHPMDIFTITVHDKDFGTSNGDLDWLGMDDDFLGWVDFPVIKLPHNTTVNGWFDLRPEHHYVDSVAGRKRRKTDEHKRNDAGNIQLSLKLTVKAEKAELFALMLPQPHFGEDLPKLDMVNIFDTYTDLKSEMRLWQTGLQRLYYAFPKDPWVDAAAGVSLVWWPKFVPCVIFVGSACLTWQSWIEALRKKRTEGVISKSTSLLRLMAKSASQLCSQLRRRDFNFKKTQDALGGLSEPLLAAVDESQSQGGADSEQPRGVRRQTSVEVRQHLANARAAALEVSTQARSQRKLDGRTEEQKLEDEATHELGSKLSTFQAVLVKKPKDKEDMRRMQKVLELVTEQVVSISDFVDEDPHLLLTAIVLTMIGLVLGVVHHWLGVILQVSLTAMICSYFLKNTIIGRFIHAVYNWVAMNRMRRKLHFALALEKDIDGNHRVSKEIARSITGLDTDPLETSVDFLKAKGHAHELVRTHYVEPTWCYGCGGFLWGVVSHQGLQCQWCYRNFCRACAAHASDTETGPRSCDVPRPIGWEETASNATGTNVGTRSAQPKAQPPREQRDCAEDVGCLG